MSSLLKHTAREQREVNENECREYEEKRIGHAITSRTLLLLLLFFF